MSPASGLFAESFVPMSQVSAHCGREEEENEEEEEEDGEDEESSGTPNICQSTMSIKNSKEVSKPSETNCVSLVTSH